MFERVLVPLDGSALARATISRLGPLFAARGARISLLRVIDVDPQRDPEVSNMLWSLLREEAERGLQRAAVPLREAGLDVETEVALGPAATTILDRAERGATSIAMSTHGHSGLARWALGSVAEKVLRASAIPVLLTRGFVEDANGVREAPERWQMRRVVVPIDGSPLSLAIVPHLAALIAGDAAVGVSILRVVREAQDVGEQEDSERELRDAARVFGDAGLDVTPEWRYGHPATEILRYAAIEGCDMIAMTTHGRVGPLRWALGSVAERVLRRAPCPMLIARG